MRRQSRQERAAARAQRRVDRQRRREERERLEGPIPPLVQFAPSVDELLVYDRAKNPVGHALRDLWRPNPGFLVCGGPSLKQHDLSALRERGVMSLGVNNVSGLAPVRAFVCSDPPEKFHHGIWLDPAILKLVPSPKLPKRVRAKLTDGSFRHTSYRVMDCPNVWGFARCTEFDPATFLTSLSASWGVSAANSEATGRPKVYFTMLLGLRLLHYLGCRRVYLLGVDFHMTAEPGGGYAFSQNRWPGAAAGNNNSYRLVAGMLAECKPYFDRAGFEVYNCNPTSSLRVFPHVPFEAAVEDCRGGVPREPFDLAGWYEKPGAPDHQEEDRGSG